MRGGAYSNRVIAAESRELDPAEVRVAHRVGYGTIRWLLRIDHALREHSNRTPVHVQPLVWDVLRTAGWELLFGSVPAPVAVAAAVDTVREVGHPRASGFVNAVLRSLSRHGEPPFEDRALAASVPTHVMDLLDRRWGPDRTDRFLEASNRDAPLTWRARPPGDSPGPDLEPVPGVPDAYEGRTVPGSWVAQDGASTAVGWAVGARPGDLALDMAAAPGGKTLHLVDQGARVVGMDIHSRRLARAQRRLREHQVVWVVADGTVAPFPDLQFERVLVDAPCTGLGVVRRRPEIKYRVTRAEVRRLAQVQRRMLTEAERMVAPGGRVVYSVCTVTAEETIDVVGPGYGPPDGLPGERDDHGIQLAPDATGTDGMFIAVKTAS